MTQEPSEKPVLSVRVAPQVLAKLDEYVRALNVSSGPGGKATRSSVVEYVLRQSLMAGTERDPWGNG